MGSKIIKIALLSLLPIISYGQGFMPSDTSINYTVGSNRVKFKSWPYILNAINAKVAGLGSGTVTSVGKSDGYGVISSISNPTTTPVISISIDTSSSNALVSKSHLHNYSYSKAQVNAIASGVNTGDQTLSFAGLGQLTISGSGGNTVGLTSLTTTTSANANTISSSSGLNSVTNTTGSSNYPATAGGALRFWRTGGTALGFFEFWKSASGTDELYFRTGASASAFNNYDIVMGRNYAASIYAPLASPVFTGTPTAPTAAPGTNTTQIATMAALQAAAGSYAKLSGGNNFSGNQNVLGNISSTDGTTFNASLQSYTFSGPGQGSQLLLSNRNPALSTTMYNIIVRPSQSQQSDVTLTLPRVNGIIATQDDAKQDTLLYAGGGTLSTIPSLGKKRTAVVGSITYVNTNLPATASIGDTFTLMGELNSLSATVEVKYYNNASGDFVESNNGTTTIQTTAGTSGYISVWPGSSVTIMLLGTSPKVYRVISQTGKVTYN